MVLLEAICNIDICFKIFCTKFKLYSMIRHLSRTPLSFWRALWTLSGDWEVVVIFDITDHPDMSVSTTLLSLNFLALLETFQEHHVFRGVLVLPSFFVPEHAIKCLTQLMALIQVLQI